MIDMQHWIYLIWHNVGEPLFHSALAGLWGWGVAYFLPYYIHKGWLKAGFDILKENKDI